MWSLLLFDGLSVVPLVLTLLLLRWQGAETLAEGWRARLGLLGAMSAALASLPLPLFRAALHVMPTGPRSAGFLQDCAYGLMAGCLAGVVAVPMLAVAKGRTRWVGLVSTLLSLGMMYLSLLSLSSD